MMGGSGGGGRGYGGTFEIDSHVQAALDVVECVWGDHEQLRVNVESILAEVIGDALPPEVPRNTCI